MPVMPILNISNNSKAKETPMVKIIKPQSSPMAKINIYAGICASFTIMLALASSCAAHFPFFTISKKHIFNIYRITPMSKRNPRGTKILLEKRRSHINVRNPLLPAVNKSAGRSAAK